MAILAVALWLYFDSTEHLKAVKDVNHYFIATYILIATGSLMAIVGFLGCCGALRESQCMLGTVSYTG